MKTWMRLPTILPVLNDFWNKPGTEPGMTQMDCLEKDGLGHPFLCPGMDSIPQGARKAVRLCPGRTGRYLAPAISALPPSVVVVFRKEPGREVRLLTGLVTEKYHQKMVYACHTGFVYA